MKILKTTILGLLSLALPLLDIVTFRHTCDFNGDMGPEFYGLPFIYRTEIPWVNSLSGDFYLLGYAGNVVFFGVIILIVAAVLKRVEQQGHIKKIWNVGWIGTAMVMILFSSMFFFITEWHFDWTPSEMINYANQSAPCTRTLEFCSTGN
jgi:hypothetical protein